MFPGCERLRGTNSTGEWLGQCEQSLTLRLRVEGKAVVGGADFPAAPARESRRGEGVDPPRLLHHQLRDVGRELLKWRQMALGMVVEVAELLVERRELGLEHLPN